MGRGSILGYWRGEAFASVPNCLEGNRPERLGAVDENSGFACVNFANFAGCDAVCLPYQRARRVVARHAYYPSPYL